MRNRIQSTLSNLATLGTSPSLLVRGVGGFALGRDISKWPHYRGSLISGVQIRGSSLVVVKEIGSGGTEWVSHGMKEVGISVTFLVLCWWN